MEAVGKGFWNAVDKEVRAAGGKGMGLRGKGGRHGGGGGIEGRRGERVEGGGEGGGRGGAVGD